MNDRELCRKARWPSAHFRCSDVNADMMAVLKSGYALHESWGAKAADTIERLQKENKGLISNIKPEDIGALFVANGKGARSNEGDHIKLVALHGKVAHPSEYLLSRGQAENLAAQLTGLVLQIMRRGKDGHPASAQEDERDVLKRQIKQEVELVVERTNERDAARAEVEQQRKHIGGLEYHLEAARAEVGRLKARLDLIPVVTGAPRCKLCGDLISGDPPSGLGQHVFCSTCCAR